VSKSVSFFLKADRCKRYDKYGSTNKHATVKELYRVNENE